MLKGGGKAKLTIQPGSPTAAKASEARSRPVRPRFRGRAARYLRLSGPLPHPLLILLLALQVVTAFTFGTALRVVAAPGLSRAPRGQRQLSRRRHHTRSLPVVAGGNRAFPTRTEGGCDNGVRVLCRHVSDDLGTRGLRRGDHPDGVSPVHHRAHRRLVHDLAGAGFDAAARRHSDGACGPAADERRQRSRGEHEAASVRTRFIGHRRMRRAGTEPHECSLGATTPASTIAIWKCCW